MVDVAWDRDLGKVLAQRVQAPDRRSQIVVGQGLAKAQSGQFVYTIENNIPMNVVAL
ncbi:MAG: hypothetical protein AAFR76_10625 [Planctomycetota bacterium]